MQVYFFSPSVVYVGLFETLPLFHTCTCAGSVDSVVAVVGSVVGSVVGFCVGSVVGSAVGSVCAVVGSAVGSAVSVVVVGSTLTVGSVFGSDAVVALGSVAIDGSVAAGVDTVSTLALAVSVGVGVVLFDKLPVIKIAANIITAINGVIITTAISPLFFIMFLACRLLCIL